ncbi:serine/threonine-protein kinase 11-interacting protein [Siphateles boraxobius]|uniref:serine/threonine-protein kinase 11-interacting protein n=1 Tax=Siphateles boraxobius TaxID=180520 RepID=UPI004063A215
MTSTQAGHSTVVHRLATLLRNYGDSVLDGSSTLTLLVGCLQHLTQLFERHLLSRTHQHGFLALPSHPADTASLLEVQFLFDMLQKTVSLKLVNPPGVKLQYAVKIFPFKSLKYLELKRIPPHCLEGLRGVYSQLEVFTCSKGVSSLEELLSLCGGDLSSALPWLELHTLNFSYNSISRLDESLNLLNVLKWLDLSHNKLRDCAEFLKPLTELEHLNLAYNNLQRAPALGLSAQAKLTTLILRNNQLETINGVEQLSSLQCLDLAYNLLMDHSQLAPLSLLHNLNTLTLEGNPLYFQKTHRASTVCHLSQASFKLQLDGTPLSQSDLLNLPKSGQLAGQISHTSQHVSVSPDQGGQEVSSGCGDITDSVTESISGVTRVRKRKHKSKVKVRRASISEPSDTDHEIRVQSALQDIVLPHKKDIERMDSFREQLGEDWLRYQHHLDDTPVNPAFPGVESVTIKVDTNGCNTPPSPLLNTPPTSLELLPPPLLSSELKEEEDKEEMESTDLQPETESTLQWTGQSLPNTESTLETSLGNNQAPTEAYSETQPPPEEDDDDRGVDLCRPMLVGLLSEDVETNRKRASEPLFLRVWQGHLLEVEMHQGCVKTRVELDSLRDVVTTEATCTVEKVERTHPALELHFRYISRERRKRCYIMLDNKPQEALQVLAEVLSRVVEENKQQVDEEGPETVWLQCLKCQAEFCQPATESDNSLSHLEELRNDSCTVICSECNSDHVVQLSVQSAPSTSTPLEQNDARYFTFDDRDNPALPLRNKALVPGQSFLSCGSPLHLTQHSEASSEGATAYFHTAHSFLSNCLTSQNEAWVDQRTSQLINFSTTDVQVQGSSEGFKEKVADNSCYNSYQKHQDQQSPKHTEVSSNGQFDLLSETVDHRLQLYLDVEVFGGEEELRCFLKMSIVKFGDKVEFHSLMVVSDQYIYILEITSQSDGQPSDWLRKRESHRLCELSYLEVGLGSQSIHLEFDEGPAAYTLLVRNSARCKWFFSKLTEIARELAPKTDSKLKGISTTRLNPQHHLWHLVCEDALPCDKENSHPPFRYLLAFLQQDGSLDSMSVLATKEMLFLLDEDHQWSKSQPEGKMSSGKVTVQETQPISCLSSIHLFSSNPCQVDLKLYDEMTKKEKTWSLRAEDEELVQDLVDWITNQWEKMFGVKLATIKQ